MTPNFWIFCCNPRANCDIAVVMGRKPEARSWRVHPNQNRVKKGDFGFIRSAHNQKNYMADRKEHGLYVYCEVVSDVFPHNESALADKDRSGAIEGIRPHVRLNYMKLGAPQRPLLSRTSLEASDPNLAREIFERSYMESCFPIHEAQFVRLCDLAELPLSN